MFRKLKNDNPENLDEDYGVIIPSAKSLFDEFSYQLRHQIAAYDAKVLSEGACEATRFSYLLSNMEKMATNALIASIKIYGFKKKKRFFGLF